MNVYTNVRDTIQNQPAIQRHFAFAVAGIATIGLAAVGVPNWALGGIASYTIGWSSVDLRDFLKNLGSYMGGCAVGIAFAYAVSATTHDVDTQPGPDVPKPEESAIEEIGPSAAKMEFRRTRQPGDGDIGTVQGGGEKVESNPNGREEDSSDPCTHPTSYTQIRACLI